MSELTEHDETPSDDEGSWAAVLSVVTGIVFAVVFFGAIKRAVAWWYHWSIPADSGSWLGFLLGLAGAVVAGLIGLVILWKIYEFLGQLGESFKRGWQRGRTEPSGEDS